MISNNPIAIDAGDLQYYDKQIKKYIDTKDSELRSSLSDVDSRLDAAVSSIEVLEGDENTTGSVANLIKDAIDDLDINNKLEQSVADAKSYADSLASNYATAEQGGKADTAIQTVTASTGLTATKSETDVSINFDDNVTFIFDCGNSGVNA